MIRSHMFLQWKKHQDRSFRKICRTCTKCHYGPPDAHSWKTIREELKRCFSHQTSLGHAAAQLENMSQKPNEPSRLYFFRYSKIHKSVTKQDACYNTDPSRWFRFLTSITNTTILSPPSLCSFLEEF